MKSENVVKKVGFFKRIRLFRHQNFISLIIALLAYMVIPLPSYVSGMISGGAIAVCGLLAYQWWNKPPKPNLPFVPPDVRNRPPLRVPEMKESKNIDNKFMVRYTLRIRMPI